MIGFVGRGGKEDVICQGSYSKMKKVTCMEQVEIGVRPYVRIINTAGRTICFKILSGGLYLN